MLGFTKAFNPTYYCNVVMLGFTKIDYIEALNLVPPASCAAHSAT
jgi:hypothetical protein